MKNKIILACTAILLGGLAQAQVGINTQNPAATLDVVAKNATGQSILPEGLLVPRVDRERAQSMNTIATSTLIYVNSVATGTQTGIAVDIDTVGYYYFDGTKWVKLNSGPLTDADTNIYNEDGTLTGNRTVTQNANKLAFTGSAVNAFSVDGTTLSVDGTNHRVGLGTATPNSLLDLGMSTGKKLAVWTRNTGDDFYGFGAGSNVLQVFAGALADGDPLMTLSKSGRVGIGTQNPAATLDVVAKNATGQSILPEGLLVPRVDRERAQSMNTIATSTLIYVNSVATGTQTGIAVDIDTVGYYYFDGTKWVKFNSGPLTDADTNIYNEDGTLTGNRTVTQNANKLAFTGSAVNAFSVDGTTLSVDGTNHRVGLGTATPNSLLDLGMSTGKKLAVWARNTGDDFYGFGAGSNVLQVFAGALADGDPLMTLSKSGRVGIGTTAPQANFHAVGTRRFEDATPGSVPVGAILTATDTNGTAEWKTAATKVIVGGATGAGISIPFTTTTDYRYTGVNITLPPGKWAVNITELVNVAGGALDIDDQMFLRTTFTDQNVAVGAVATRSADTSVVGGPSLASFRIAAPGGYSIYQGTVFINNTSGGDKTYGYIAGNSFAGGSPSSSIMINDFGSSNWSENSMYAIAIQ